MSAVEDRARRREPRAGQERADQPGGQHVAGGEPVARTRRDVPQILSDYERARASRTGLTTG
ncbi:MAG: hypothetical protein WBP81_25205 [Solirubrobacteraceae bacterium]